MATSRSRGGSRPAGAAGDEILPAVGCSSPASRRSVVVLPQPEEPMSTSSSWSPTSRQRSSTARIPPGKVLPRWEITIAAMHVLWHPRRKPTIGTCLRRLATVRSGRSASLRPLPGPCACLVAVLGYSMANACMNSSA